MIKVFLKLQNFNKILLNLDLIKICKGDEIKMKKALNKALGNFEIGNFFDLIKIFMEGYCESLINLFFSTK